MAHEASDNGLEDMALFNRDIPEGNVIFQYLDALF